MVVTALWAASSSMPVVSAMICAMSGMQAVEPSVTGNSSSVRMGAVGTSLAEEAGVSDEAALDAGVLEAASPQAASSVAVETAPSPSRKERREILDCFMVKPSLNRSSCWSRHWWK